MDVRRLLRYAAPEQYRRGGLPGREEGWHE